MKFGHNDGIGYICNINSFNDITQNGKSLYQAIS